MAEIKPCPFCGGSASIEEVRSDLDNVFFSVGCDCAEDDCVAFQMQQTFARRCEAIAAWNKRPLGNPSANAGVEAAARYVEALWDAHTREFGIYDPSTNATEFTGASEDIDCLYQELIEGIRALDDARVDRAALEIAKAKEMQP